MLSRDNVVRFTIEAILFFVLSALAVVGGILATNTREYTRLQAGLMADYADVLPASSYTEVQSALVEGYGISNVYEGLDEDGNPNGFVVEVEVTDHQTGNPLNLMIGIDYNTAQLTGLQRAPQDQGLSAITDEDIRTILNQARGQQIPVAYGVQRQDTDDTAEQQVLAGLNDGIYYAQTLSADRSGYIDYVEMSIENGMITMVQWDAFNVDMNIKNRRESSLDGVYEVSGLNWASQSYILCHALMDVQNPDTFTPEERVWQQESDRSKPHNEADDTFVNPTESDFPQEEAIRIAKEAILKAYSLPDDALNHVRVVTNLYVTEQRPDYRRWFIQFQVLREGSDDYVEKYYSCIVDPEGNVIGDPDINEKSVFEYAENKQSSVIATYNDYVMNKAGGWVFQYWSPELKADFSEKVLPEVSAIVESGDLSLLDNGGDIDYDLMAIATHRYGLPRETDITVEQAYQIAVDYLKEHYGLSEDIISHYDQWYYSYDTTDPDNPKWCIVFWPGGSSAMYLMNQYGHDQSSSNYRIEINPSNGTVLNDVVIRLPYSKELSWLVNRY